MMSRSLSVAALRTFCLLVLSLACSASQASAQTVARCGKGWLEKIDGYSVLHLKGTPAEMGWQHGTLLKDEIRANLDYVLNVKGGKSLKIGPIEIHPKALISAIVKQQREFTPRKFFEEMDALADATGLQRSEVEVGNFIPEMFHCSGFAVMNSATRDGTLYHGRVLDYAVDWGLQEHAVLIVAEPEGGIPFVNVTYAGFIGSVTGMNAEHISIGEMGGGGVGHWRGVPMSFLVRDTLETAHDLDEAIASFRDRPRTCQYFYVVADGKNNRAVGMEASWNVFTVLEPGEKHPLLPIPVTDSVLLSAGDRYRELARRAQESHGKFSAESALRLMDCPVAMKSNLHNVLFEPRSTRLWVANASKDKQPAANQPYHAFQLSELLKRNPSADAPELPPPSTRTAAK
ncbi:MAG TPA: C45 family peptidase [Planctomycetaceae bacterium]|nr:C45 family peptidase [Planctomycetaceae bacterium]